MHSQLAGLPDAVYALLPELATLELPTETLADCARCAMLPDDESERQPWHFNPATTCCTYHPDLANYLVGRALRRGGAGAERVRSRLLFAAGRDIWGLHAPPQFQERYVATRATAFGQDAALLCPFRSQDVLSCTIWNDRNSVCRTWFCKSVGGRSTQQVWVATRHLLARVEVDLARFCAQLGSPPEDHADVATWEAWFVWCADAVDSIRLDKAPGLRTVRVQTLREELKAALDARADDTLPDVVRPNVRSVEPSPLGVRLTGYSRFDGIELPRTIFEFLARLDGATSWREAARLAQAEAQVTIDDAVIQQLFDLGVLRAPDEGDDPNGPEAPGASALFMDP